MRRTHAKTAVMTGGFKIPQCQQKPFLVSLDTVNGVPPKKYLLQMNADAEVTHLVYKNN